MNPPSVEITWNADQPHTIVQVVLRIGDDERDLRLGTGYNLVEALEGLVRDIRARAVDADEQRMRKILENDGE